MTQLRAGLTFMQGDTLLDSLTKRIGFRTVELIQEPLEEPDKYGKGTTFLFEVNGVRMFMGGERPSLSPLQNGNSADIV